MEKIHLDQSKESSFFQFKYHQSIFNLKHNFATPPLAYYGLQYTRNTSVKSGIIFYIKFMLQYLALCCHSITQHNPTIHI